MIITKEIEETIKSLKKKQKKTMTKWVREEIKKAGYVASLRKKEIMDNKLKALRKISPVLFDEFLKQLGYVKIKKNKTI